MEFGISSVALKSGDIIKLDGEVIVNIKEYVIKEKAQKILDICPTKFMVGNQDRELKFLTELIEAYYNYTDSCDNVSEKLTEVGWFLYAFYEGWKRGIL